MVCTDILMNHFLEVGDFIILFRVYQSLCKYTKTIYCWKGDDDHYHINNYSADEAGTGKLTHNDFQLLW